MKKNLSLKKSGRNYYFGKIHSMELLSSFWTSVMIFPYLPECLSIDEVL